MSQGIDSFLRPLGLQRYSTILKQRNILTVDDLKQNSDNFDKIFQNQIAVQRVQTGLTRGISGVADGDAAATPQPPTDPLRDWEHKLQEKIREISRQRAKLVIERAGRMDILQISQEAEKGNTALRLCHKAIRLKERLATLRREARGRRNSTEGIGIAPKSDDVTIEAGEVKVSLKQTLQEIRDLPVGWAMRGMEGNGGGDSLGSTQRSQTPPMTPASERSRSSTSAMPKSRRRPESSPVSKSPRGNQSAAPATAGGVPTPPMSPSSLGGRTTATHDDIFERLEGMLHGKEKATTETSQWMRHTFTSLQNQIRSLQSQFQIMYEIQHVVNRIDNRGGQRESHGLRQDASCQTEPPKLFDVMCSLADVVERNCGTLVSVPPPALLATLMQSGTPFPAQWNAFLIYTKDTHTALEEAVKGDFTHALRSTESLEVAKVGWVDTTTDESALRQALVENQASVAEVVGELKRRLSERQ